MKLTLSKRTEATFKQLQGCTWEPVQRAGAFLALKVQESSQRSFAVENKGTPDSGYTKQWAHWKPSTQRAYSHAGIAKRRAKRAGKGKGPIIHSLLYATGTLMRSIVSGFTVESKTRARVKAGVTSAAPYGAAHQMGTPNMVARPFMGITPKAQKEVVEFYQAEVKAAIYKAGK